MEQISLLSTSDTPSREKGKQNTINSTSSAQEIKQYAIAMAQHAESNIRVWPGGTILITPPNPYELPNEIMAHIFSYIKNSPRTLYACTLANKRCYDLANSMLWKAPAFRNYFKASLFLDCMLTMTHQRRNALGRLIHSLRLTYDFWAHEAPSRLILHMRNLQHLTLAHCNADKILHKLPAPLISLKLNNRAFVTDSGFAIIAQYPLEVFDWKAELRQLPVWLTHLGRCPLRRLSMHCTISPPRLHNIEQLTATDIAELLTRPLASFLTKPSTFPQLTYLNISLVPDINDFVLTAFFKNHPLLEQLHLSQQDDVTDASLDAMHLPRLTRASLTYLDHITSPAVRRLINACPLIYLDIRGCKQVVSSDFPEVSVTNWGVLNSPELDKIRASV